MNFITLVLSYYFLLLLPLACFVIAAVIELRSQAKGSGIFLRLVEMFVGAVGVIALPSRFWGMIGVSSYALSWAMVFILLMMALISPLSKYASRAALSLALLGNVFLAFLWYFNGAYHH
jgi:hypothetical protein